MQSRRMNRQLGRLWTACSRKLWQTLLIGTWLDQIERRACCCRCCLCRSMVATAAQCAGIAGGSNETSVETEHDESPVQRRLADETSIGLVYEPLVAVHKLLLLAKGPHCDQSLLATALSNGQRLLPCIPSCKICKAKIQNIAASQQCHAFKR